MLSTSNTRKLSCRLDRGLSLYVLAASAAGVSALALAPPANAQVVYTPAHQFIHRNGQIVIDFNRDGVTDVTIREIPWNLGSVSPGNSLQAVPSQSGGGIKAGGLNLYAAALSAGEMIGPQNSFWNVPAVMAEYTSFGSYFYGSWALLKKSAYVGVRFLINGKNHYGWARLKVKNDFALKSIIALLTGYAYETTPNKPILAGATGKGPTLDSADEPTSSTGPNEQPTLGALALGAGGIVLRRGAPLVQQFPF